MLQRFLGLGLTALLASQTGVAHGDKSHGDLYSTTDTSAAIWLNASHGLSVVRDSTLTGHVQGLHITGPALGSDAKDSGRQWSILVWDGESTYARIARKLHRQAATQGSEVRLMQAGGEKPVNAVAMIRREPVGRSAKKVERKAPATTLLGVLQRDQAIANIFANTFEVDVDSCIHGRNRNEVFMILQNHTMWPDNFHSDICDDAKPGFTGITVVNYPHDRWDPKWQGHFEFGASSDPENPDVLDPSKGTLIRLAPLRGRTVVFDGCAQHRATNPTHFSTPLAGKKDMVIAPPLHSATGFGQRQRWWHWNARSNYHGWRFAVAMQMRCRKLTGNESSMVNIDGTEDNSDQPRLVSVSRKALSTEELNKLRHVRQVALEGGAFGQDRNFGTGDVDAPRTLFVHQFLDKEAPGMRARLLEMAIEAAKQVGWDVKSHGTLNARCMEYITYKGNESHQNIGWHQDGSTIFTQAVVLSDRGAYVGGALEFSEAARVERITDLDVGDAAIWRGWTQHRVTPILTGTREVFVIEWWIGADCTQTLEPRAEDGLDDVLKALELSPNSPAVHRWLGQTLCETLPCESKSIAEQAEAGYRKALELEPQDAGSMYALGNFLQGSRHMTQQLEALKLLREAHEMNPELVGEVTNKDLKAAEQAQNLFWKAGLLLCILVPSLVFVLCCDRQDTKKKIAAPQSTTKEKKQE